MVETVFPRQKVVWESLWESKERSSLFQEALRINKYLLNWPFPWVCPSCLPTGSIGWWWWRGPRGTLCVCLRCTLAHPTSPHPPGEAVAPRLICNVGFCQSSAEQLPAASARLSTPTGANRLRVARREGEVRCAYAETSRELCCRADCP